jgi:hypothetical protein
VHWVESRVTVGRRGDRESLRWAHNDEKLWHPIFNASSDAFFFVGYGTTRRKVTRFPEPLSSDATRFFPRHFKKLELRPGGATATAICLLDRSK